MKKQYYWLLRHNRTIIYTIALLFCLYCICHFKSRWNEEARYYSDNIIIEVLAGLLLSSIPLLIGLDLGKKIEVDLFHFKFRELFRGISEKRISNQISPKTTQDLVIDIAKNLGSEITEQSWYRKIDEKIKSENCVNANCGVCGLDVKIENERCQHCKLNFFAWKFDED